MYGQWEDSRKIKIAREYLMTFVDSLEKLDNVELGLRVYGHQSEVPPQDCNDTKLEVPISKNNGDKIKYTLRYLRPKGTTPIARSLELAKYDFPECDNCRNIIILITDGREACEGDPCEVSKELQKDGIILKPFIIGIGLDPNFEETFKCVGKFYNSPSKEKFKQALDIVISKALNSTTAQVNLLDSQGKPTETNVAMTFYEQLSGKSRYNFIHTIDYKGNPDTLILDPLIDYKLVVHTLPEKQKDSISLTVGKHNMIGLDAPQGMLKLVCEGTNQYRNLKFIVRQDNKNNTLNVQQTNETVRYITGTYDLEVLTLPRLMINDVEITQSHTTKIEIPKPGILNVLIPATGYGTLFTKEKNGKLKRIYNLSTDKKKESLILQPGTYEIAYRPKNMKRTMYTTRKSFTIKSGSSTTVTLH
jgi:Ca-activated chloride channel family protein